MGHMNHRFSSQAVHHLLTAGFQRHLLFVSVVLICAICGHTLEARELDARRNRTPAAVAPSVSSEPTAADSRLADRVFTWAVVLQKVPVRQLVQSLAGLLVVDPDAYTRAEVEQMQRGHRLVLAYLSVGEAEAYRRSFSQPEIRSLIIRENPDWKDNFRVAYWDNRWSAVMASSVSEILSQGFDGLFLDVVDAWEDYPASATARADMARLICRIADQAHALNPQALILLQNSHELFEDPTVFQRVDGLSQESLHASWSKKKPAPAWLARKRAALARLRQRGKFIGLIEYTRDPVKMRLIKEKALRQGFIPYFTTKNLERLFPIP